MAPTITDALRDNDFWTFVLLTLVIGGGAAWRTGQAVAEGWGALWPVVAYTGLLAAAIRFLHFALFGGPLLSPAHFGVDFAILSVIALFAHRIRRTCHMCEQYPWLFVRMGPFSWRRRKGA